jgi:hypothetical protein
VALIQHTSLSSAGWDFLALVSVMSSAVCSVKEHFVSAAGRKHVGFNGQKVVAVLPQLRNMGGGVDSSVHMALGYFIQISVIIAKYVPCSIIAP